MEKETRTFTFDIELRDDENPTITGHAAMFNQETDIGGMFREKIKKGAFSESIGKDDVRALFNHDPNFVLGRKTLISHFDTSLNNNILLKKKGKKKFLKLKK